MSLAVTFIGRTRVAALKKLMGMVMESSQVALNAFGTNSEISALFMLTAEVEMNFYSQLQVPDSSAELNSAHG